MEFQYSETVLGFRDFNEYIGKQANGFEQAFKMDLMKEMRKKIISRVLRQKETTRCNKII